MTARWYARQRGTPSQIATVHRQAAELTGALLSGDVLEVAPGPGYLAIEIARLGRQVTAVDMRLSALNALLTRFIFRFGLLKRAYTTDAIERMVSQSRFGRCQVALDGIAFELQLSKETAGSCRVANR